MAIDADTREVRLYAPFYPIVLQFPVVCFTLVLCTDVAYWITEYLMWSHFSSWLLLAGLIGAGITAVVALIEYLVASGPIRSRWPLLVGGALTFVLALLNSLVHAGDGWTAVVPWGLTLSAVTVIVMIITAFVQRSVVQPWFVRGRPHD